MVVAIDGPAGSGKTTVAKLLAKKLNFFYLDTGATYRTLTLKVLREGVNLEDKERIEKLAQGLKMKIEEEKVYLDGEDVSHQIRTPLINKTISLIACLPGVRKVMVDTQRRIVGDKDAVVEGRDITTVVFPFAEVKFYLTADFEERVKRRYRELKDKGINLDLEEVKEEMRNRDEADLKREIGGLKIAEDAIYIDTTNLTIEEVRDKLFLIVQEKMQTRRQSVNYKGRELLIF